MMKPAARKQKGSSFELEVAKRIASDLCINQARYLPRAPESGARESWKGDIVAVDELKTIWLFLTECKKVQGWSLDWFLKRGQQHILGQWYVKACEQAEIVTGRKPLLIFARNYQPWLVAFPRELLTEEVVRFDRYVTFGVQTCNGIRWGVICCYDDFSGQYLIPTFRPMVERLGICEGQ